VVLELVTSTKELLALFLRLNIVWI